MHMQMHLSTDQAELTRNYKDLYVKVPIGSVVKNVISHSLSLFVFWQMKAVHTGRHLHTHLRTHTFNL